MIAEGIQKISELVRQSVQREILTHFTSNKYQGLDVSYEYKVESTNNGIQLGEVIKPFRPPILSVSTLTGFIDAVKAIKTGDNMIHIQDYRNVALKSTDSDKYGIRETVLLATYTPPGVFLFDTYQDSEKFLIGLETSFFRIDGDDTDYVKKLASNLKSGNSVHAQDDGINQKITVKLGEINTTEHDVRARVKLTPIRTFNEAAPVESEFLIRFKTVNNGLPEVALFNLNGLRWQNQSMLAIKHYLGKHLEGIPILA